MSDFTSPAPFDGGGDSYPYYKVFYALVFIAIGVLHLYKLVEGAFFVDYTALEFFALIGIIGLMQDSIKALNYERLGRFNRLARALVLIVLWPTWFALMFHGRFPL